MNAKVSRTDYVRFFKASVMLEYLDERVDTLEKDVAVLKGVTPVSEPENPLEHFLEQLEGIGVWVGKWDSYSVQCRWQRGDICMSLIAYEFDGCQVQAVWITRNHVSLAIRQIDAWEVSCCPNGIEVSFWVGTGAGDGAAIEVRGLIPHE